MQRLILLIPIAAFVSLAACGGGGGGNEDPDGAVDASIHVSASNGNDADGDGTSTSPYRSITRALEHAAAGDLVRVGPGDYDAVHGEVFPLMPAPGVTIRGTEAVSMFGMRRLSKIHGGGVWPGDPDGRLHATMVPSSDTFIVGLSMSNPEAFGIGTGPKPGALLLASPRVVIESCHFVDSVNGIRIISSAGNVRIRECDMNSNGDGILITGAGPDVRVDHSRMIGNDTGVFAFEGGVDFGGGSTGSEGVNVFAQNNFNDFVVFSGAVSVRDCLWDVDPLVAAVGNPPSEPNADLWVVAGSVDHTGAGVYMPPFPQGTISKQAALARDSR